MHLLGFTLSLSDWIVAILIYMVACYSSTMLVNAKSFASSS